MGQKGNQWAKTGIDGPKRESVGQNKNWFAEMRIYGLGGDAEMTNIYFSFEVVPKREAVNKIRNQKKCRFKSN